DLKPGRGASRWGELDRQPPAEAAGTPTSEGRGAVPVQGDGPSAISESHALRQIDGLRGCSYTRMRTRLGAKQGVRRQRMGPTSMRWVRRGLVAAVIAVLLASCSPMQVKQSGTAVR